MLSTSVGDIGTLIAGSGLEEILKSAFAGVPKMLTGKKFQQNVLGITYSNGGNVETSFKESRYRDNGSARKIS